MSTDRTTLGIAWVWKSRLGEFSLRTAIAGVVLPGLLAVLYAAFRNILSIDTLLANSVFFILCANFEILAFGFGIARRRTATGRAGLIISSVVLLMVAGLVTFFLTTHPS